MAKSLQFTHRLRIEHFTAKAKFDRLDRYLEKLAAKDFDVAGVPFRLLDGLLTDGAALDADALHPLARHTVGGQPRLLGAVLNDLKQNARTHLQEIITDEGAHPMTRFEAMGWATFLAHRAAFPTSGTPVTDMFQYWDSARPPAEVMEGKQSWQSKGTPHVWYDDTAAHEYIRAGFGRDAAKAYADLWHPALKSDVFRLYRLAQDGGVYCDADSRPEHRAAAFFKVAGSRVWASSMTSVPNCVAINGFLAAPAQNPLIEGFLQQVLRNIRDVQARGIFWLSGPGAFTTFLYQTSGKFDLGLLSQGTLKADLFRQFDAVYKQTDQNWRVFEHAKGLDNAAGVQHALAQIEPQG